MAINETKSTGNKYRRLTDAANMVWQRLSFWTHASDVEFDNNTTLASNLTANGKVFKFDYSGGEYGYKIDNTFHAFGGDHVKAIDITAANWSSSTTTLGGIPYYSCEMQCTKIYSEHPIIGLTTTASTNVLPTANERADFALLGGAVANLTNNRITFYATVKPTRTIRVLVKDAD